MTYSFQPFLDALGGNWYADDPLLERLLRHFTPAGIKSGQDELHAFGGVTAGRLRELAVESADPRNAPWIRHYDAYNRRVDEVVLPASTHEALGLSEGRFKLGAPSGDPFVHYAKYYLSNQNGEAGVGCSIACTDGFARVLEDLGDRPEHRQALARVRGSTPERVVHAAQFVTEIQGGSDVGANSVRAVKDGDAWRLHGQKWFCSNCNADYFLVTARPEGGAPGVSGVGLFLVPAWLDPADPARNGHRFDRLKEKLGTRELATAELTFEGARAWAVGPLDRGVANVVGYVLVASRVSCVDSAASTLRQATRHADAYLEFRSAFGRKLTEFPLVRAQATRIREASQRALATLFELVRMWEAARAEGEDSDEAVDFRVLLSMAKPVLTRQATELMHDAIMLLGANGVEERFCNLSRLYRDAVIMETWEGPHTLLFNQAWRDMLRFEVAPRELVERLVGEPRPDLAAELDRILAAGKDPEMTVPFARLAEQLVEGVGRRVLAELD